MATSRGLWYDNIRRQLITSGELAKLRDEGIMGVTSNPTIFEKAVSGSTDYGEALVRLVREANLGSCRPLVIHLALERSHILWPESAYAARKADGPD